MFGIRYRMSLGAAAFVVQRLSGVVLAMYVFAHLYIIGAVDDPILYERLMRVAGGPLVRGLELCLIGVVAAHALNGLRVSALELGAPSRLHGPMLAAAALTFLALMSYGAYALFGGAH